MKRYTTAVFALLVLLVLIASALALMGYSNMGIPVGVGALGIAACVVIISISRGKLAKKNKPSAKV